MRAAFISALIVGLCALIAAVLALFYIAAGALGVVTGALFDKPYVGVAVANTITLLLVLVMVIASLLTVAERKWSALMQDRIGPNRARLGLPGLRDKALLGIPHFLADGIKMLTKEDFVPAHASGFLYTLAPMLAFGTAFVLFAVVPVAPTVPASEIPLVSGLAASLGVDGSFPVSLQVAPGYDPGVLFIFAFAGIAVFGTALAGWASNNRLALLGGLRGSSQMVAYEIALGMSLVGLMMIFQTLQLEVMTEGQNRGLFGGILPAWGIFLQPIGFILYFTASFAELKRPPFDAPEGESEIVGYFVEYSGMRFGLFMISEFIGTVVLGGVVSALFLGGYHLPFPPAWGVEEWLRATLGDFGLAVVLGTNFVLKVIVLCWLQLAIRWTMPRFRFDKIQSLGWKILLPAALVNIAVTAVLLLADPSLELLAIVGLAEILFIVGLTALYPKKQPTSLVLPGRMMAGGTGHH